MEGVKTMRARAGSMSSEKKSAIIHDKMSGNTDSFIKNHKNSLNDILNKWFRMPAYRYTPSEQKDIWKENR